MIIEKEEYLDPAYVWQQKKWPSLCLILLEDGDSNVCRNFRTTLAHDVAEPRKLKLQISWTQAVKSQMAWTLKRRLVQNCWEAMISGSFASV